jgi:polar amino acid transport system substrate-binding protein
MMMWRLYWMGWVIWVALGACGWARQQPPPPEVPTLKKGVLKWGADSQGGAPYCFQDPANPAKLIGFETEMINKIAGHLGLRPEHIQNDWGSLPLGLDRGLYDIICNGLEITPEHEEKVDFSIPYCLTYSQLTVKDADMSITSLETCSGRRIGTLKESQPANLLRQASQKLVEAGQPPIDIKYYDDEVNAYQDLGIGRLEGVFVDAPVAIYYAPSVPGLKFVGGEIGKMEYGIAVKKGDAVLLQAINSAITRMITSGELREIYLKWNLWDHLMAKAWNQPPPLPDQAEQAEAYQEFLKLQAQAQEMTFWAKIELYWNSLPALLIGAWLTLQITIYSMALAVAFGFFLAIMRTYGPPPVSFLAAGYIELVRGTPLLIQLFFIFYGLPRVLHIELSPFQAAIIGLGCNYAAYEAENYRAGLQTVPRGQMEAALALGMTRAQALRFVIIPQAFRIVIPPITNDFISLLKDSSLVSVITMVELTKVYQQLSIRYFDYFGFGIVVAILYLLLGLPFVALAHYTAKVLQTDRKTKV